MATRKIQVPGAPEGVEVSWSGTTPWKSSWSKGRILAGVHDASSLEIALDLTHRLLAALKENP
jgi:hypothetical protein